MIDFLYAQGDSGQPEDMVFSNVLFMVSIIAIFYFLIIRPQSKRQKALEKKRDSLKKGDKIVTSGGIIGKVEKIKDEHTIVISIAPSVQVELLKSMVLDTLEDTKVKSISSNSSNKKEK